MVLIGYWPLSETYGKTAYDYSQNNNHGKVYNGGDGSVVGKGGNILGQSTYDFDGDNDYVGIEGFPSVESSITVAAWIKSTSGDNYTNSWNGVSRYQQFILGPESGEMSFIVHTPNNGWTYLNPPTTPDKDRWHHFVGVWKSDTGECELWMDGKLFTSSDYIAENPSHDTDPVHIAHREARSQGTDHLQAQLSSIRIYNRALTSAEIRYLYSVSQRGKKVSAKKMV